MLKIPFVVITMRTHRQRRQFVATGTESCHRGHFFVLTHPRMYCSFKVSLCYSGENVFEALLKSGVASRINPATSPLISEIGGRKSSIGVLLPRLTFNMSPSSLSALVFCFEPGFSPSSDSVQTAFRCQRVALAALLQVVDCTPLYLVQTASLC